MGLGHKQVAFVFFCYSVTLHSELVPRFSPDLQTALAHLKQCPAEAAAGCQGPGPGGRGQKKPMEVAVSGRVALPSKGSCTSYQLQWPRSHNTPGGRYRKESVMCTWDSALKMPRNMWASPWFCTEVVFCISRKTNERPMITLNMVPSIPEPRLGNLRSRPNWVYVSLGFIDIISDSLLLL